MSSEAPVAHALFVCLHNAGRSQISQALFDGAAEGRPRGTLGRDDTGRAPPSGGDRGHGRDRHRPLRPGATPVDGRGREWADVVVTMGCGDECPYVPGTRYVDWDLPDPKGRPVAEVRDLRDRIQGEVDALLADLD